jgi:hypothetical protein
MTRKFILLALALSAAGCGGDGPPSAKEPVVVAPTPTPPPTAGTRNYDVLPCFFQDTPVGDANVVRLVVPDVLTLDFGLPSTFPNGRALPDPAPDRILAMLFLNLRVHSINTFANLPLNPATNDRPFRSAFPFLAPPQGNPPVDPPGGANFNFRTDAPGAYVIVDRTGFPALSAALVSAPQKNPFNDDTAADDLRAGPSGLFKWVPEFQSSLTALTNALGDDLEALNLTLCAQRI